MQGPTGWLGRTCTVRTINQCVNPSGCIRYSQSGLEWGGGGGVKRGSLMNFKVWHVTAERIHLHVHLLALNCVFNMPTLQAALKSLASQKKCATQIGKTRFEKQMELIELQLPSLSLSLFLSLSRKGSPSLFTHTHTHLCATCSAFCLLQRTLLIRRIGHTQVAAQHFTRHTRFPSLSLCLTQTRTHTH